VALAAAALATGGWSADAAAATSPGYYVSVQGSDAGNGTKQKPWRTIRKATSTAPAGATINVGGGTYDPFMVTKAGQVVTAVPGQSVVVQGRAGVQDVIRVAATGAKLVGMTVTGCVPEPAPLNGFENNGSSGIRIHDGATGVTVQGMTVRDSHGVNPDGLPFGCYGIFVHNADQSHLIANDVSGNGAGIYFNGGGRYAEVTGNQIHDNDVIIRNTPGNNDDFGGGGVSFTNITASPGPVATRNVITGNAGPSSDYEADGGAFELYNASNLRIENNTLGNNENVLETGTGPGGRCANNRFVGNTASGRPPITTLSKSIGVILRCAQNMLIDRNTFNEIDWWVFTIDTGDQFSSGVRGLTITNTRIDQWQKVYHLAVDPVANQITVDRNQLHFTGPIFSSYADGTTSASLVEWQTRTGLDLHSTLF
jgi:parallel beta-helix repeat protein